MDYLNLSLEELLACNNRANAELNEALLNGDSWDQVKDKRSIVTQFAQEIWRKRQSINYSTPADTQIREN